MSLLSRNKCQFKFWSETNVVIANLHPTARKFEVGSGIGESRVIHKVCLGWPQQTKTSGILTYKRKSTLELAGCLLERDASDRASVPKPWFRFHIARANQAQAIKCAPMSQEEEADVSRSARLQCSIRIATFLGTSRLYNRHFVK